MMIATFHDTRNQSKGADKLTVLELMKKTLQAIFTKRIFPHDIEKF